MPKKILVVDDNEDIRTSVSQILEVHGYEVIGAENGIECLKHLERTIPDLVILDIMMPGMSGWDVAARIKAHEKWRVVPIVFFTAKGDEMSMGLGGLASENYIVKPFEVEELLECVDRILQSP
ncbi:MAG TPA: response regulator [Candidatus Thermoplasmatota archaeon]|nr:response regulator [Candidatus Thermoplasmatota archaeon]